MSDDPILAAIAKLRTDFLAELGQTRGAIMAKIQDLQADVVRVRDDIAVNFGTADAATRANDNTRDELRAVGDIVTAMVRKIRSVEDRLTALEKE